MNVVDSNRCRLAAPVPDRAQRRFGTIARLVALALALPAASAVAQITLTWDDNSTDETGFKIERSDNGGAFAQITTVIANTSTYTDTTVTGGNVYSYRVRAYNSIGDSDYTNTATNAATILTQPSNQTVAAFTTATFTVTASGVPAPTYQWQKDGTPISGATNSTLSISNASAANVGSYTVVVSNGLGGSVTSTAATLSITKVAQTITFGALASKAYTDPSFTLSATATSGLTVSFASSNSSVATVSGTTVTITGVGSTTITASQGGDSNYNPAPNVTQTLTVGKGVQTITFGALSAVTFGDAPITLTAVASSGLTVAYASSNTAVATVSGNTVTIVGGGSANIVASQAGNSNYNAASNVSQLLTVNKAAQTITFTSVASPAVLGDPPITLVASSTSGLPITFFSSSSSVATVSGNTLTLVGAGSTTLTAAQAGNTNYSAATNVTQVLQVDRAPAFTTQPSNQTIVAGGSTTFATSATGSPVPTYQWQVSTNSGSTWTSLVSGAPYSGVTGNTLLITGGTASLNGNQYRCIATNSVASVASSVATLTVQFLPSFTTQPNNQFASTGGNASFTAAANGNPAVTYQWQISTTAGGSTFTNLTNTSPYSGVTTGALSISGAASALNNFRYRCVATNSVGSTNSNAAVLTVGNVAPAITANPANLTLPADTNGSFTVAASGGPAPTFQWQVSSDSGTTWTNLTDLAPYSGSATAVLTITAAPTTINGYWYRCVATNSVGSAISASATLTVTTLAPSFTTSPANTTTPNGSNGVFTAVAAGNPTPTLQWYESTDGGTTFSPLSNTAPYSGVTTGSLTLAAVTGAFNNYQYRCVATNAAGTATSTAATLSIGNVAPAFSTQPLPLAVAVGGNASFAVVATGNPTPTLQWQLSTDGGSTWNNVSNSAPYSGATTATLNITAATTSMNGAQYRCVATNAAGSTPSNSAQLAVTATAAVFTTHPSNQTVSPGGSAVFSATATGNPTPTFSWQVSTDNGTTWTNVADGEFYSGSTTTSLSISNAASSLSGNQYRCVATNVAGPVSSNSASFTIVSNAAPVITSSPIGRTVNAGDIVMFIVLVTGNPMPTIHWFKDGKPISGATSNLLAIYGASTADAGIYTVVATNVFGTATSDGANLVVDVAPTIVTQPVSITRGLGATASFTVGATGIPNPTYQWRKAGVNLPAGATAILTLSKIQLSDAGTYDVVVTNPLGSVISQTATLTVVSVGFSGTYFGSVTGGGTWALYARTDGTGLLIVYLSDRKTAIEVPVTILADGTFTATAAELSLASSARESSRVGPIAAFSSPMATAAAVTISGAITANQVSGTLAELGKTLSGAPDAGGGSAAIAGLYIVPALGTTSGTMYSIVGASGQSLTLVTGAIVDAATGTIQSDGKLVTNSALNASVSLNFDATAQKLAGTYVPSGAAASITFTGVADGVPQTGRLTNVSCRSYTGPGGDTLIGGFVVAGSTGKALLVRGVGPTLSTLSVPGVLADPILSVYLGSNSVMANDDWGTSTNASDIAATAGNVGAFALPTTSRDSALLSTFIPNGYTVQVTGKATTAGIALVEVYDTDLSLGARLINVSGRARVNGGGEVLIVGFKVDGNSARQLLIRGVGPTLATLAVPNPLVNPKLSVYRQNATSPIYENDDWGGTQPLRSAFSAVGAFPLPDTSKDAAMLITLEPGIYTAVISSIDGTSGVALAEVYDMQ